VGNRFKYAIYAGVFLLRKTKRARPHFFPEIPCQVQVISPLCFLFDFAARHASLLNFTGLPLSPNAPRRCDLVFRCNLGACMPFSGPASHTARRLSSNRLTIHAFLTSTLRVSCSLQYRSFSEKPSFPPFPLPPAPTFFLLPFSRPLVMVRANHSFFPNF